MGPLHFILGSHRTAGGISPHENKTHKFSIPGVFCRGGLSSGAFVAGVFFPGAFVVSPAKSPIRGKKNLIMKKKLTRAIENLIKEE